MNNTTISQEHLILGNLLTQNEFTASVIPYLKTEYFENEANRLIFEIIKDFHSTHNTTPNRDILTVTVDGLTVDESLFSSVIKNVEIICAVVKTDIEWIVESTESWARDRALYNALMSAVEISSDENNSKKLSRTAIPDIMSEALAVTFDSSIGHDYFNDAEGRWEMLRVQENHIPFGLKWLDSPTGGGVVPKTLGCVMAPTGGGKSQFMVHYAARCLKNGYNVVYISLEMAKERVAARIDANMLNMTMDEVKAMPKEEFTQRLVDLRKRYPQGKIILEEFPPASTSVSDYKRLLKDLKIKKNFKPDIVFVDYINLANSSRFRPDGSTSSYAIIKAVAEEMRGMAVIEDCAVFTATQVNRCACVNSSITMSDGTFKLLKNIQLGDSLKGVSEPVVVTGKIKTYQQAYKIKLKSGKEIIVSGNHNFPCSDEALKSIHGGLKVGDMLESGEIISIERMDDHDQRPMIDIEVTGDHLFYANDILTHNSGMQSSDFGMSDTSESIGLPFTLEYYFSLHPDDTLESMDQIGGKWLKCRDGDIQTAGRFTLGLNRAKMKFYDIEDSAQPSQLKPVRTYKPLTDPDDSTLFGVPKNPNSPASKFQISV